MGKEYTSIEKEQLINSIENLAENEFNCFCYYLLKNDYGEKLVQSKNASNVWYSNYEISALSGLVFRTGLAKQFYIMNYLPCELFIRPTEIPFDNPSLRGKILSIKKEFEDDPGLIWHTGGNHYVVGDPFLDFCIFVNAISTNQEEIKQSAFEQLKRMFKELNITDWRDSSYQRLHLGHPHSFFNDDPCIIAEALDYVKSNNRALSIEYSKYNGYEVNYLQNGKYVTSGVGKVSKSIFIPAIIERTPDIVCKEFEALLNSDPSEKKISEFLIDNYKLLFGNQYDIIIPEVSLRFPDLDISGKNRRIDLMLHDNVIDDWELIELKKMMQLTRFYRGVPDFTTNINGAIQQLRNYYKIMLQQDVRDHFMREGIEYYNPTMKLIIGGKGNVSHAQWRDLISGVKDVKLITYDSLIKEMKYRYFS